MPVAASRFTRLALLSLMVLGFSMPLALAGELKGPDFKGLFIFGDSLSDTANLDAITDGFLPATSPPYFQGRFSNGPLWVQTLASFLAIDVDFQDNVVINPLAKNQEVGSLGFSRYGN